MGDTLGTVGRFGMQAAQTLNKPLDAASTLMIGPHQNVPYGEQWLRLAAALAAGGDVRTLAALQGDWREQDAYRASLMSDPMYRAALERGGPELVQQMYPGVPLPPKTETGYALPPTLDELQRQRFDRAKGDLTTDPLRKQSVRVPPKGPVEYRADEREQPLILSEPDGTLRVGAPLLQQLERGQFRLRPTGQLPDGSMQFVLEEHPAAKAASESYARGIAERATRLGVPLGDDTTLPGTDALDLDKAKATAAITDQAARDRESRAAGRKANEAAARFDAADTIVNQVEELTQRPGLLSETDFSQRGVLGGAASGMGYAAQQQGRLLAKDPDVVELHGFSSIVLSALARSVGDEKGNLAEGDVKRVMAAMPSITDTQVTAARKVQRLRSIVAELRDAKMKRAGATGAPAAMSEVEQKLRERLGR